LGGEIRNIKASNCGQYGIVGGSGFLVSDCVADHNNLGGNCGGIQVGDASTVKNCVCNKNSPVTHGSAWGIFANNNCLISDNHCDDNFGRMAPSNGLGIACGSNCIIIHNVCYANGTDTTSSLDVAGGIEAYNNCQIIENDCNFNLATGTPNIAYGIVAGGLSIVKSNRCVQNTGFAASIGIFANDDSRIENNFCSGHSTVTSNGAGIYVDGGQRIAIINNTTTNNSRGISIISGSSHVYYSGNSLSDDVPIVDNGSNDTPGSNVVF
jgi:hypothetical protein